MGRNIPFPLTHVWVENSDTNGAVQNVLGAGEAHIGQVGTADTLVQVIPALDTNIYASGDVLFLATAILNAVRVDAGKAILQSIFVQDSAKQSGAFDLLICRSALNMGAAINNPEAIDDANGLEVLAVISFTSADYVAFNAYSQARKNGADVGCGMLLSPTTGTSLWIAGISRDTKTYAANSLTIKLGLLRA